ncbi:zf-PARP-domain-containing protein [Ramicandelaber brevisporus]|nr:zf-PARP-domain-containing protein [Ramicandelaber brevisporus]
MPYRIEYAKSQRSSCKGGKSCTDKSINKGELRLGSEAEVGSHTSVYWRHWRCVTGKQLQNLQEAHGDDVESIEGFSSLSAEDKDKVRLAVSSGVNADFVEVEKPPKTKKAPAAKKAKKDAKPAPKKRGRPPKKAADVEEGGDDEVKPPPKKRGRPPKKAVEAEEGAESAEAPEPKKRGRKPKAATAAAEDGNGDAAGAAAEAPAPKKRGRPPKKVEAVVESD